MVFIMNNMQK